MKRIVLFLFMATLLFESHAQNSRIIELSTEGTATNDTYFVVDKATYTRAKNMALSVVTSLEEAAREAQDDVIEAGAGLETDGTYEADNNTNFLTAAEFAGLGLTGSLKNADFILDSIIYAIITAAGASCYDFNIDSIYGCGIIVLNDDVLIDSVLYVDSIYPANIASVLFPAGVGINNGDTLHIIDGTGDDTLSVFENGSYVIFDADNEIKLNNNFILDDDGDSPYLYLYSDSHNGSFRVVESDGDMHIAVGTGDLDISCIGDDVEFNDANLHTTGYIEMQAATNDKRVSGYDATVCASGCNYTTVNAACTGLAAGSTIYVYSGSYDENADIDIQSNDHIYFERGTVLVLDGYRVEGAADSTYISGDVTLTGSGISTNRQLFYYNGDYNNLENCLIRLKPTGDGLASGTATTVITAFITGASNSLNIMAHDLSYTSDTTTFILYWASDHGRCTAIIDNCTLNDEEHISAIQTTAAPAASYNLFNVVITDITNAGSGNGIGIAISGSSDYNTLTGVARGSDDDVDDNGTGTNTSALNTP